MNAFKQDGPFVQVYRLPEKLTNGYCFGGGVPIVFVNVDWFGTPKNVTKADLIKFIEGKAYYKHGGRLLVMTDSGSPDFTFVLDASPAKIGGDA